MGAKVVRPPQNFCFNLINDEERAVAWGEAWRDYVDALEAVLQQAVAARFETLVSAHAEYCMDHETLDECREFVRAGCGDDAVLAAASELGVVPKGE